MKSIISFILIGILSLPSFFGLNHFLYEKHDLCSEQNLHFHEVEIDCCTCDFIRLDIESGSDDYHYSFNQFPTTYKQDTAYNYFAFSNYFYSFDSRGPPVDC